MNKTNTLDFASLSEFLPTAVAAGTVRDYVFFTIPSDKSPWFDTGIDLDAGERLTSFASGRTVFKTMDIQLEPNFQLWFRIGCHGEIFRGTRDSHSFRAGQAGRLYLASYFPGEWASKTGALATPEDVYGQVTGSLSVMLIRWNIDPLQGLKQLAEQGDADKLIANEIDRLTAPVLPPPGWEYLWFVGPAEIYRGCEAPGNAAAICCHTHNDVGLLQKAVLFPLKLDTRLRWAWKIDALPSAVREDTLLTHDYLSIAVEFDNGQDITYFWSAELPPETAFRCPIPTWTARETHVAVRSGTQNLGAWIKEERDVYRDYSAAIGGPVPNAIVRIWLIAVSFFQRTEGKCSYAGITLWRDGEEITVL